MHKKIVLFLLLAGSLCSGCSSNNKTAASQHKELSATKYTVTVVMQGGYDGRLKEFVDLQDIIRAVSGPKRSVPYFRFYRCGTTMFREYTTSDINFNDDVFIRQIKSGGCIGLDLQEWFECCLRSYPFDKKFSQIYIYTSLPGNNITWVNTLMQNYRVFNNINDIKKSIESGSAGQDVLIMHYFSKEESRSCEDVGQYISKNPGETTPYFINAQPAIFPIIKSGNDIRAYEFRWNKVSELDNYEFRLDDIIFNISLAAGNKDIGTALEQDGFYAEVKNNIVTCFINEDSLGARCEMAGYGTVNRDPDCKTCRNSCVYEKKGKWNARVRGYCGNVYGKFGSSWNVQLKCAESNKANQDK